MKLSFFKSRNTDSDKLAAIGRSQAIIEFTPEGIVNHANQNFLDTMGYTLSEVVGKHHSMFVDPEEVGAPAYKDFWNDLKAGNFRAREFRRISKSGRNVWIQASYNPVMDHHGVVTGIVKIAVDITAEKSRTSQNTGLITAINASQAVIHFSMDGTIQDANNNFCKTLGYDRDEILNKHHSIFVAPEDRNAAYDQFWDHLRAGKFQTAEFKRITKSGDAVYIQATYTPILNFRGKPYQVVKFATDITERVKARMLRAETSAAIDHDLTEIEAFVRRASNQAQEAARASSESSANVESVATGSAQLASSISEIAGQASKANDISRDAVERAASANSHIQELSKSADQIGAIISLISDIAEQTNLLALNATIEAARAGEAGKGFAVVASEVKQLATQSARASKDISSQILAVQNATGEAVSAIASIAKVISDVNDISLSISGAVEEQAAVTQNISQNMSDATNAVASVSDGINTIAEATREIEASTQKVKMRSASLAS